MSLTLEELQAALPGRYRVERELGRGGMATVYLAEDLPHHRRVAIKVLEPALGAALGPERFLREIEIASRLTHPHILPVHDSGAAGTLLYYVMPYVEGATLRERLAAERQLPVGEAVRIACEVARGLEYAHAGGVMHRDLKPENVLLEGGEAVIADFGIARAMGEAGQGPLTATGVTLGTPAYMSPEQCAGGAVDARSDVYALGCVLYEMLAGETPYTGPTAESIVHQQLGAPVPDVRLLRPGVPGAVAGVVTKALAKTAADRWQTAAELRAALAEAASATAAVTVAGGAGAARGARPRGPRRIAVGVGSVALVAALAVAGWAVWRWFQPRPATPTRVAILPFSVHGREDLAYLGEGMASLLATTLDGVGDLRCVDAATLLKWAARERAKVADPEVGAAAAARFGAGLFVLGELVELGPRLRLQAALYERRSAPRLVGRAMAEGDRDSLTALADELALGLVAQAGGKGTGTRLVSVAARTTPSLPALRAFLEGEWEGRRGSLARAAEAYGRAVELDSAFAIALYRLALAGSVAASGAQDALWHRRTMLERAARHADRLAERDRKLVLATRAATVGDLDQAERLWKAVLVTHPDDVEALTRLGTALFVFNGTRGRSPLEAGEYLWRACRVDPEEGTAAGHLFRVLVMAGRPRAADSLARDFLSRVPTGHENLEMHARLALHLGTPQEQDSVARELAGVPALLTSQLVHYAAASERPDVALRLAAAGESMESRLQVVIFALTTGRWLPGRLPAGDWTCQLPLLFCGLPFGDISRAERDSVRAAVARLPVSDEFGVVGVGGSRPRDRSRLIVSRPYREYLLGLLSARLGEQERALAHARRLDALRDEGDGEWRDAARDFAASIRATVLLARGRAAEGLGEIERAPMRAPLVTWNPIHNRVYERFLRAELLHAAGRDEEALRWYSTLHSSGSHGILYLAPCHLRQAQIHERMGRRDEAIRHYRRFVELWKDCDPQLRPEVERARGRLSALVTQTS